MEDREEVSREISSILAAEKMNQRLPVAKLDQLYYDMISERIPFKKLGYPTLVDYLKTLEFIEVNYQSGHHTVDFLGTKNTKHLSDLVAKQRNSNKKPKSYSNARRNIPPSYFHNHKKISSNKSNSSSDYRRHGNNIDREKLARSSHCIDDDKLSGGLNNPEVSYFFNDDPNPHNDWKILIPTVDNDNNATNNFLINRLIGNSVYAEDQEEDQSERNDHLVAGALVPEYQQQEDKSKNDNTPQRRLYDTICQRTRFRLEKLIQSKPDGIWCAQLPKAYFEEYKIRLDWEDYEFDSLIQFVHELPEIFQFDRDGKSGDFIIYDATRPIPSSRSHLEERKKLVSDYQLYTSINSHYSREPALDSLRVPKNKMNSYLPPDVVKLGETVGELSVNEFQGVNGAYEEVVVVEPFSPSFFFIHLKKNIAKFDDMMNGLGEFYETSKSDYVIHVEFEVGLNIACKFYGKWHRGIIKEFTTYPEKIARIFFYDYGTMKSYPANEIYFLQRAFGHLPAQAIPCGLYSVRPPGGTDVWPESSAREFVKMVHDKPIIAQTGYVDNANNILLLYLTDTSQEEDIHINDRLIELGIAVRGTVRIRPKNILNKLTRKLGQRVMQKRKSLKLNTVNTDNCSSLAPMFDQSKSFLDDNVSRVVDKVEKEIENNPAFLASGKNLNVVSLKDYIRKVTKDLISQELRGNNLAELKNFGDIVEDKVERKIVNSSLKPEDGDDTKIKNIETVQDLLLVKDIVNSANFVPVVNEELPEKKSSSSSGLKNKVESRPFGKPILSKLIMPYDEYDEIVETKKSCTDAEAFRPKAIEKSSSSSSISKSNNLEEDLANQNSSSLGEPGVSKLIMAFDNDDNFGTNQESSPSSIAKSDCIDWEFFGIKTIVQEPEEKKKIQKSVSKPVRKNNLKFNQRNSLRINQRSVPKFSQRNTQKINEKNIPKVNEESSQSTEEEKGNIIRLREGFYELFNDNQTNCVDNYQNVRKDESSHLALLSQTEDILRDTPKYEKIIIPKTFISPDDLNPHESTFTPVESKIQEIPAKTLPRNCKNIFQYSYKKIIAERLAKKNQETCVEKEGKNSVENVTEKSEVEKVAEKVLDVDKEPEKLLELDSDDLTSENESNIIPKLQEIFGQANVDENFCSSPEQDTKEKKVENKTRDEAKSGHEKEEEEPLKNKCQDETDDPTELPEEKITLDVNERVEKKIDDAGRKNCEKESEKEQSSEEDLIPASSTSSSFARGDGEKISNTTMESTEMSEDLSGDSDVDNSINHVINQEESVVDKFDKPVVVFEEPIEPEIVPATYYPSGVYPVFNDIYFDDVECPSDESEWEVNFEVKSHNAIENRQDSEVDVDEIQSDLECEEAEVETTNVIEEVDSDFEEEKQDIVLLADEKNEIEGNDLNFVKEKDKINLIVRKNDEKNDFEEKEKDIDVSIDEKNDSIVQEDDKENQDPFVHQNELEISSIKSEISTESDDDNLEVQVKKLPEHSDNNLEKTPKPKLSILTTIKNLGLHENCNLSPPPVLNMSLNEYRKKND